MTYPEALDYMFTHLPMFQRVGKAAMKNDLDTSLKLDEHFHSPHREYKTVHVAGTNGKGSVSHLLASVLQSAGYKTGLYTSPHLIDFRERIRINGQMIEENEVITFLEQNKPLFETLRPSFFEMATALAFWHFANQQVDVAVIETGLGGRLDSTNIISPLISVITNIGFDHTDILGGTIEKIAGEKAGIIKAKTPVVIGESDVRTRAVFNNKAKECTAPISYADDYYACDYAFITMDQKQSFDILKDGSMFYEDLRTDLLGFCQQKNILTVLQSIDVLSSQGLIIEKRNIYDGVALAKEKTGLMGRWQILSQHPTVVCDTGHNEEGIATVVQQINRTPHKHLHWVFGVVNDKPIDAMLRLLPKSGRYYFTKASIPRALDEQQLVQKATAYGLKGKAFPSVSEALHAAKGNAETNDLILVGGSTFIVAEVLSHETGTTPPK